MNAAAVIVAGGSGERFGGAPKQFRLLGGRPVLRWSVDLFAASGFEQIVVVARPEHAAELADALKGAQVAIAKAGATRTESVRSGLAALAADAPDAVLIHDAARPLASAALVQRVLDALTDADGAAPCLAVADALKQRVDGGFGDDVARAELRAVQTPQGFRFAALWRAYQAVPAGADFFDDVAVARGAGLRVTPVPGERTNMKATFAEDLEMMERLAAPPAPRFAVGHGFDVHRLEPGDGVDLCGVRIPCGLALVGHSDADAGLHALCDAMLGAAGAGDIGQHFPPSDPKWRGADSAIFVTHCLGLLRNARLAPAHADITLICERPKIDPHREAMRARVAALLGLPPASVNIKATTTERLGFLGRGEGLAAEAVFMARGL